MILTRIEDQGQNSSKRMKDPPQHRYHVRVLCAQLDLMVEVRGLGMFVEVEIETRGA